MIKLMSSQRLKQSERVDIIAEYLRGVPRKGYKVIESKDKDGNDKYMVRKLKPEMNEREAITQKISKLQAKLDKLDKKVPNENDKLEKIKEDENDVSTIKQSE